ncbi:hypothetical protein J2752_000468 [Halarchaeum rubridurum]|uniref:Uncharacterized protein n=1 Tax=Halarchaeum rubridurum TaxID=489911 RepID=A0A830FUR3_9EURY|nr:hypothetical protein [Halarchaeum rubridurum]MBP1953587.1 hypothetical protein [Halarchaeum rubridurum]GGM64150.1 hypothetical protein GCM10009017_12760 [Halarchaeum rubridurum]
MDAADALGTGLAFESDWDFELVAGSIGTVSGIDCLGRDLAFALERDLEIGQLGTVDARKDVEIDVRDLVSGEDRVQSIDQLDVREPAPDTVEIDVALTATTGERGQYVFTQ